MSPDNSGSVTLIANWIPFEEPAGGPNFYPFSPDAHYNIKLDTNGDSIPDITYQRQFQTMDLRGTQTFLYNHGPGTTLPAPNRGVRPTTPPHNPPAGNPTATAPRPVVGKACSRAPPRPRPIRPTTTTRISIREHARRR